MDLYEKQDCRDSVAIPSETADASSLLNFAGLFKFAGGGVDVSREEMSYRRQPVP